MGKKVLLEFEDAEVLELDAMMMVRKLSRTGVIREAVREYLERNSGKIRAVIVAAEKADDEPGSNLSFL